MKTILSRAFVCILILTGAPLIAQQTTEVTLVVEWANSPVYDNVTSYTITLTPAVGPVFPPQIGSPAFFCILDKCKATFEKIPPAGYYAKVYATNAAGNGPSALATYNIMTPSEVKNVSIKKG